MSSPTPNSLPKEEKVQPKPESTAKKEEPAAAQNATPAKPNEKENKTPAQNATPAKPSEKENKTPAQNVEGKENGTPGVDAKFPSLREQFRAFSKFGDTKSDGKHLTLSQSDKWMKQAKVIEGKTITTTDTAIHFKKFKQVKIQFPDYEKYLADLAKAKKMEDTVLKNKMRACGLPGTTGTTAVVKNQAVDRLTDTKKFTGSHKIRVESPNKGKTSPSPWK